MSWYKIRLGGTNEFASLIDPDYKLCCPPGTVEFVEGWSNPDALIYKTKEDAEAAMAKPSAPAAASEEDADV